MFEPNITYREGKKHGNADGLSRMAVETTDEDEEDVLETPINRVLMEEVVRRINNIEERDEVNLSIDFEQINSISIKASGIEMEQQKDPNIVWIYNLLRKEKYENETVQENEALVKVKRRTETNFENNEQESYYRQRKRLTVVGTTLYREYVDDSGSVILQYVVPSHLREVLIKKAHDSVYGAHQGRDKVLARLRSRCYWPKMIDEIANHVKTCEECQLIKPLQQARATTNNSIEANGVSHDRYHGTL